MKILDPNRVAFDLATQHCPLCAERVVREKVVGGVPAGFQRILASCIACDFEQLVQWGDGDGPQHAPQTVVRDESLPATAGRRSAMGESPTIHRPHCVVPGCARLAAENLLCNPHWVEWKNSGEPDRAAWAAQHTPSRGQQLAERRGPPHATPKEPAMSRKKTMEQCGCSGCDRPVKCSGLCNAHYTRWIAAKKPPMDTFLADKALAGPIGRSSPRQYRIHQRRQLQAAAPSPPAPRPSGAAEREAITPAAVPEPQAPSNGHGLGVFTHIVLAEPATGILIGRVGQFITIADARGGVLHQMPAA